MGAELAAGATARDLVPGDPDELDRLAARLSVFASGMTDAADKLGDVEAAGWTGPAAQAFSTLAGEQPKRYRAAGSSFGEAISALHAYTGVLRRAQADAGRALTLVESADRESERWRGQRAAHDADVRAARADGGPPPDGPAPPASDPGGADRAAAQRLLGDAREQVRAQGRVMAAALSAAAGEAPEKPGLLDRVIDGVGDFFGGVWEGVKGIGETVVMLAKLSTIRMLIDPEGWRRDVTDLGKGLRWGITHPVEFGKAIVDWETWKSNPLRAFGKLVPDIAIALATAGTGTAASASARGASRGIHAAGDAADAARGLEHGTDAMADAGRAGRAADDLPDPGHWPLHPATIDEGKYDYLFGRVASNSHNTARSQQNAAQMARLGVEDGPAGRALLQQHFDDVVRDPTNVVKRFTNDHGTFEVRESLFAGPSGQFAKFESTWQVTDNGRRLTTVIPRGGNR